MYESGNKQLLMERSVQYGKTKIDYILKRSKRKTLAIEVHPDLMVKVIAPFDASIESIDEKVVKRGSWIERQKKYFESFLPRTPKREYVSGETHLYLGKRYLLKVKKGDRNSVKLKEGCLMVFIKEGSKIEARHLLASWYKEHAEGTLQKHFTKNLELFEKHAIVQPEMNIKRMKKRWGSYTASGKIILNPELIKAPVRCIDYVIIHELCHSIEPLHNKTFYDLLENLIPDWKRWKDRLENMHK